MSEDSTFSQILRRRAEERPEDHAFGWWGDRGLETWMTYRRLDEQARAVAAGLQACVPASERALLLYAPGFEYVAAFFGCLHAGVIAVPAYPPELARLDRTLPRLLSIIADAQATLVLTTSDLLALAPPIVAMAPQLSGLRWLATDTLQDASAWREPAAGAREVACLQYTSGSTGDPRGVRLTNGNLIHNARSIERVSRFSPETRMMAWVPPYHDLGLMGSILQPVYSGFPSVLMSPVKFLMRPLRWLQAISATRATSSGGPNFAYDLCARKVSAEQRRDLDLSSWTQAYVAAEPVQQQTLERFAARFADCGFSKRAFYPCYGLAEATLMVTGVPLGGGFRTLGDGMSMGREVSGGRLLVVDPERGARVPDGEIGEIWVQSASVADGYWNRPDETRATFGATLAGEPGAFLRTGDLGRLIEDELIVTGRLKELIVIRGRKHFPADIESTVEHVHWDASHFRAGGSAAVSQLVDAEEHLFLIVELERRQRARRGSNAPADERRRGNDRRRRPFEYRPDAAGFTVEEVTRSLRNAVALHHGIEVSGVVLVRPGSIPKTSSGKKQRLLARQLFLGGGRPSDVLFSWSSDPERDKEAPRANLA
jgi:acyl-CoA synthetase (AMP-forming)/AMP-acid ligase II